MATPWASQRKPKLLKSADLADQEFLLEETRASKLLYVPGPVLWLIVFGSLTYLAWAPSAKLPAPRYLADALSRLASVLHQDSGAVRSWTTVVLLVLVLFGILWLAVRFLRWSRTVYAVTNRRVLVQSGILSRGFDEIPVTQVRGVDVHQTALQRLLGYGTIRVSSEGGVAVGNEDWLGIPKPFRFQKLVENATVAIQSAAGAPATTGVR